MSYDFGFYSFLFPDELQDPWLTLGSIGIERRTSKEYYFVNTDRDIDSYLFQYTLRGEGIYENAAGQHRMKQGQAFFIHIPGNDKYFYPDDNKGEPWDFIFLLFKGEHVKRYFELITSRTGNILELKMPNGAIASLLNLYEQTKTGRILHPFLASEFTYQFLCQLCQIIIHNTDNYSKRTRAAIKIMEDQYDKLQGISNLAEILHISPNHLTREFTKETGVSPIHYLTNIRLQHAATYLRETNFTIQKIALLCGFSSGNYFTKTFRKYMKYTPKEFRHHWR